MRPLLIPIALLILLGAAPQDIEPDTQQDEHAEAIEKLSLQLAEERKVAKGLEDRVADLESRLANVESRLTEVLTWTSGLDKASGMLSSAADNARKHGFEWAAPNPLARTDIIEGLKGFATTLLTGRPSATPKKAGDAKTPPPKR